MTGMTRHEEEHGHDHDHGHGQAKLPHGHAGHSGGRRGLLLALTITSRGDKTAEVYGIYDAEACAEPGETPAACR